MQGPGFAGAGRAAEADGGSQPVQVAAGPERGHRAGAGLRLLRRAAEPDIGRGRQRAAEAQVERERRVAPDREDFLRHRLHVEVAGDRRAVQPGELERELVHARVEARALAVHRIEVEGLAVGHDAVAVGIHADGLDGAIGLRIVGLLGQAERVVEVAFLASQGAADDGQRTADRVDPLLEGREHQRVTAVDHLVVDRHHADRPRGRPVGRCEQQLRNHRGGADGAQAVFVRRLRRLGQAHQHLGVDVLLVAVGEGVADGENVAAHGDIVSLQEAALGELVAQRRGDVGQGVAELRGVTHGGGERRIGKLDVLQLQRPDLAGGKVALQLNGDGGEFGLGGAHMGARDLHLGRTVGRRPHRDVGGATARIGIGIDADRHFGVEVLAAGDQQLRRLGKEIDFTAAGNLQLAGECGAATGGLQHQQLAADGRSLETGAVGVDQGRQLGGHRRQIVAGHRGVAEQNAVQRELPGITLRRGGLAGVQADPEVDRQARRHGGGITAGDVAVDRAGQPGRDRGEVAAAAVDEHIAVGQTQRCEFSREIAVAQVLEHPVDEGIHTERGVGAGQGEHPVFARRRRAAELYQRPVGGDAHLIGLVFAEGRIRVEGLAGVIGARGGRNDVDDDVLARLPGEDDAPCIGHRRARQVIVVVGLRNAGGRQHVRHPRGDVVVAVETRNHRPVVAGDVEVIGLGLRVVTGDGGGLPGTRPFHHLQSLAVEFQHIAVDRVSLHRYDQVVFDPVPDARQGILRIELVVGDDRGHTHRVGFRTLQVGEVLVYERVEGRGAAGIDRAAGIGVVVRVVLVAGFEGPQALVRRAVGIVQVQLGADRVGDRLEHRDELVNRQEAEPEYVVIHHPVITAGEYVEAAGDQPGLVDIGQHMHVAAAHGGKDDWIAAIVVRRIGGHGHLVGDQDAPVGAARQYRLVEQAGVGDRLGQPGRHGPEVALAVARAQLQVRNGVRDLVSVQDHLVDLPGGHIEEIGRIVGDGDDNLVVVGAGRRFLARAARTRRGVARPAEIARLDHAAAGLGGDLDAAVGLRGGVDARIRGGEGRGQEGLEGGETGAHGGGPGNAAKRVFPDVAGGDVRRITRGIQRDRRVRHDDHVPRDRNVAADRGGAGHGWHRHRGCAGGTGAEDQQLAVLDDRVKARQRIDLGAQVSGDRGKRFGRVQRDVVEHRNPGGDIDLPALALGGAAGEGHAGGRLAVDAADHLGGADLVKREARGRRPVGRARHGNDVCGRVVGRVVIAGRMNLCSKRAGRVIQGAGSREHGLLEAGFARQGQGPLGRHACVGAQRAHVERHRG